jgi:ATP-dependent helicase Lhr and Lhr-like helicase
MSQRRAWRWGFVYTKWMRIHPTIDQWFKTRSWVLFPFQKQLWQAVQQQQSGLLHATTGSGKTYAAWFAVLNRALLEQSAGIKPSPGLKVLWITPMRALAADTTRSLAAPLAELGLAWTVDQRTADTTSAQRTRQNKKLPDALVTTPESLTLMLSRPDSASVFESVQMIVLDEWHELMGNKRGVQVQLALARLKTWQPNVCIWGLSATLGNTDYAMQVMLNHQQGVLIQGNIPKRLLVDTLLPSSTERFPWGGHLGIRMRPDVVKEIEASNSCLIFTNTRSQAEIWYGSLLDARPDWAGLIALHHGSLDRDVREWVEAGLKAGSLKAVVCTSSLDLGVDFSPVERVLQIGSAKGVARILQRAGRSGHAPGQISRVTLVPTNALELIESAALQDAVAARQVEPRFCPINPLDVLIQHLVTIALAANTTEKQLHIEVKSTFAFAQITDEQWQWALGFAGHGGSALAAYPQYHRIATNSEGFLSVPDAVVAKRHRMSIGTIVSDASMQVKYLTGGKLGSIEESFISRLKKGDCFLFAGKLLELHRTHDMTAYVKKATGKRAAIPRWNGGKMPLSSELASAFLGRLEQANNGQFSGPEMALVKPLLQTQMQWSSLPTAKVLVAESLESREGFHLFVYPFAGRQVHIGLSSLLAWRLTQMQSATFSIAVSDYGFELLSAQPVQWANALPLALTSTENLMADILSSLNSSELALRRFREIARISGLIFQGYPGASQSNKQLQASSGLFYEVFRQYDAQNELLTQAQREVLEQELDIHRLKITIDTLAQRQWVLNPIKQPTPFAFPLMIERLREKLSTEKLADRIARMVAQLEKAATP